MLFVKDCCRFRCHLLALLLLGPLVFTQECRAQPEVKADPLSDLLLDAYILRAGKIPTDDRHAAIELVAARSHGVGYLPLLLEKFENAEPNSAAKRNLLTVLSRSLARSGGSRFYAAKRGVGQAAMVVSSNPAQIVDSLLRAAEKEERSELDKYVVALRNAWDKRATKFFRQIIQIPDPVYGTPAPPRQVNRDSKFHAAVALAELGHSAGVEWLINFTEEPVAETYINTHPHVAASTIRSACCQHSLVDLTNQEGLKSKADWQNWWRLNKKTFRPQRRVRLREWY